MLTAFSIVANLVLQAKSNKQSGKPEAELKEFEEVSHNDPMFRREEIT